MQKVDYYEEDESSEEDMVVVKVEGDEMRSASPYYMEGTINGNNFKTMIHTGSPVRIFAIDEILKNNKRREMQVRRMIPGGKYVDFNRNPLELLGYVFCELEGGGYIWKTRILVAKK